MVLGPMDMDEQTGLPFQAAPPLQGPNYYGLDGQQDAGQPALRDGSQPPPNGEEMGTDPNIEELWNYKETDSPNKNSYSLYSPNSKAKSTKTTDKDTGQITTVNERPIGMKELQAMMSQMGVGGGAGDLGMGGYTDSPGMSTAQGQTPPQGQDGLDLRGLDFRPFMQIWDNAYGTNYAQNAADPNKMAMQAEKLSQAIDARVPKDIQMAQRAALRKNLQAQLEGKDPASKLRNLKIQAAEQKVKSGGLAIEKAQASKEAGYVPFGKAQSTKLDELKLEYQGLRNQKLQAEKKDGWKKGSVFDKYMQTRIDKQADDIKKAEKELSGMQKLYSVDNFGYKHKADFPIPIKDVSRLKRLPGKVHRILDLVEQMKEKVAVHGDLSGFMGSKEKGEYMLMHSQLMSNIGQAREFGALQKAEFEFLGKMVGPEADSVKAYFNKIFSGTDTRVGQFHKLQETLLQELEDEMGTWGYTHDDKVWDAKFGGSRFKIQTSPRVPLGETAPSGDTPVPSSGKKKRLKAPSGLSFDERIEWIQNNRGQ